MVKCPRPKSSAEVSGSIPTHCIPFVSTFSDLMVATFTDLEVAHHVKTGGEVFAL